MEFNMAIKIKGQNPLELQNRPAAYVIEIEGKGIYVGSTSRLRGRIAESRSRLKHGEHHNKDLQIDYTDNCTSWNELKFSWFPCSTVAEAKKKERELATALALSGTLYNKKDFSVYKKAI
jgi:hypothetical protein